MFVGESECQWLAGYFDARISAGIMTSHNVQRKKSGKVYEYDYAIPFLACSESKVPQKIAILQGFGGDVYRETRPSKFYIGLDTEIQWKAFRQEAVDIANLAAPFLGLNRYLINYFNEWASEGDTQERLEIAERCQSHQGGIDEETQHPDFIIAPTAAYMAGMFDSSGSVSARSSGDIQAVVVVKNRNMAGLLNQNYGGHVHVAAPREKKFQETGYVIRGSRNHYSVMLTGSTGEEYLRNIYPYLMVYKELVEMALSGL